MTGWQISFRGQKRKNDTHVSKTDPDARLYRKGQGKEAKLCYMGHVLMENRNGLAVDSRISVAEGTAERKMAVEMIKDIKGLHRITVGCDKGYDSNDFIENLGLLAATPHVARKLPFREAAKLYGEIFMPMVFLPARGLGYLWYLIKKDQQEESPCLHVIPGGNDSGEAR